MEPSLKKFFWEASQNDEMCDIYFACCDGVVFSCHKLVLMWRMKDYLISATSFSSTSKNQEGDSKENPIILKEMPGGSTTFEIILKYVYCHETFCITPENVLSLLAAADRFMMSSTTEGNPNLKELCFNYLSEEIISNTLLSIETLGQILSQLENCLLPDDIYHALLRKIVEVMSSQIDETQKLTRSLPPSFTALKDSIMQDLVIEMHLIDTETDNKSVLENFLTSIFCLCNIEKETDAKLIYNLLVICPQRFGDNSKWTNKLGEAIVTLAKSLVTLKEQPYSQWMDVLKIGMIVLGNIDSFASNPNQIENLFFLEPKYFLAYFKACRILPSKPARVKIFFEYLSKSCEDLLSSDKIHSVESLLAFLEIEEDVDADTLFSFGMKIYNANLKHSAWPIFPFLEKINFKELAQENLMQVLNCDGISNDFLKSILIKFLGSKQTFVIANKDFRKMLGRFSGSEHKQEALCKLLVGKKINVTYHGYTSKRVLEWHSNGGGYGQHFETKTTKFQIDTIGLICSYSLGSEKHGVEIQSNDKMKSIYRRVDGGDVFTTKLLSWSFNLLKDSESFLGEDVFGPTKKIAPLGTTYSGLESVTWSLSLHTFSRIILKLL